MADFEGQRAGEKLAFIFRRHILTAKKGMFFAILLVILGLTPYLLWPENKATVLVWVGFVLLGVLCGVYSYILWYFSYYLVTNERIRQVRQKGIFKKSVVDLELDKIHNISFEVPGIWGGIFGYGTIMIQTQVGDLILSSVSKPEKIYNRLQDVVKKAERNRA